MKRREWYRRRIAVLAASMRDRRLNLLAKFSLLSFVCIGLLSLALAFVTTHALTENMVDSEWQGTADVVRYQVGSHGLEQVFADPALHQDRQRFRETLEPLLSLHEVVRVKVWDAQGAVIWSDDERLIGRSSPGNRDLQEALAGRVSVQLKALKKAENVHERERSTTLAEVYVPIFARGHDRRVIGVLEIYKVPARLFGQLRSVRAVVWSTSLAGGALLYLSLFWIVRVAYRSQLRLQHDVAQNRVDLAVRDARNAELDSFVYSVSHDLRAPLVAIQGMAGALVEDYGPRLDADGRHYLDRIQANVERMERLISDLLALSRVGREGRPEEAVNIAELIDELSGEMAGSIDARGVKVVVRDATTLWGIRTQLQQVFANLLGNAIKYSTNTPAPVVEIGTVDRGEVMECYVRDNGVGIDPAYHERIFEVFQRLKEVEADGTGVGLAIVKKIVASAGGRVWVESAKGQGSTFRFTWPKRREPR